MNQVLAISEEYVHVAETAITSVSPNSGPLYGGNLVTISGINFPSGVMVHFGPALATITSATVNSITVLAPPAEHLGGVTVSITTPEGKTTSYENGYLYSNGVAAVLTGETTAVGPVAGGTVVTLQGANFVPGKTSVSIGNIVIPAAAVTVHSSTSLTFTTPPHAAGTVLEVVITPAGPSNPLPGGFTYVDPPTISSLIPTSGSLTSGTPVIVTGTNFVLGNTSVTIGNTVIPASAMTVSSATTLSFTAPPGAAGTVDVTVVTPGGSATMSASFTFSDNAPTVTSLSPSFGPIAGGTTITITGNHFEVGATSVTIGGIVIPAASVTVTSAVSLTCTTPAHGAGVVDVNVTTTTGSSGFVPGGFTYEAAPTITSSLVPGFGPISGGTLVNLIGTNFVAGNTSVTIGGITLPSGSVVVNSATSLSFTTPAHAAGSVDVSVSTSGGTSTLLGGFNYENPPTATSLSPVFGSVAGGTSVTINGTNFVAGNTSVTIGGLTVPPNSVTVNSSTSLTFSTPAHASGNVALSVSTSGGTSATIPGGFTYEDTPTVSSLSPAFGPTAGGTLVTINGSNFVTGNTSVTIGGQVLGSDYSSRFSHGEFFNLFKL